MIMELHEIENYKKNDSMYMKSAAIGKSQVGIMKTNKTNQMVKPFQLKYLQQPTFKKTPLLAISSFVTMSSAPFNIKLSFVEM